jgi:enamine deaminase RidA (YjgF/YER057c/UK114 family)
MAGGDVAGSQADGGEAPIAAVVRAGNTLYLAGQVAYDENGEVFAPGDLVRQAERVFDTIREILAREGASMTDIVRLVNYFAVPLSREVAEQYWEVRRRVFGDHRPASTGVQVVSLIEEGLVIEIEAIAFVR